MANNDLSWQGQLDVVRNRVVEQEKQRQLEKKLLRERNEKSLRERLETDTVESLSERFDDCRERFDVGVRKFYPLEHIESVEEDVNTLNELLVFYTGCMKDFARAFTPAHNTEIPRLLREIEDQRKGLDRQLKQWREVRDVLDGTVFRARTDADDELLVTVAKSFSERAHRVQLSLPGNYFTHEGDNFWVAQNGEFILGYVKFFPEEKVVAFAVVPHKKVNFNKFIRGILYKFFYAGPLTEKLDAASVHITYGREVKFFTDLGFSRVEIKGPSDWIYQRAF